MSRGEYIPSRWWLTVSWLLCAVSAPGVDGGEASAPGDSAPFSWKASYTEALKAARKRRVLLLVYFPPVAPDRDPPVLARAARSLGAPPVMEGVRVGAGDVEALLERLDIQKVPAIVLLDRRENILYRQQGGVAANLWRIVKAVVQRQARRDDELRATIREAREIAEEGRIEEAYRRVAPLLSAKTTPPELQAEARAVEELLAGSLRRRMLRILAAEGLRSDREIGDALEVLQGATRHPGVRREVAREIERLRRGTIGAR